MTWRYPTVDGQNPAPPRMMIIHEYPIIYRGFNHPRWCRISAINRMFLFLIILLFLLLYFTSCERHSKSGSWVCQRLWVENSTSDELRLCWQVRTTSFFVPWCCVFIQWSWQSMNQYKDQLMVNWWFGLAVWIPKGNPGIQTANPNYQLAFWLKGNGKPYNKNSNYHHIAWQTWNCCTSILGIMDFGAWDFVFGWNPILFV